MAQPTKESKVPQRRNKIVGAGEAAASALGPALKKRGFATRDLLAQWSVIAPPPYNRVAAPDRLSWPRGERSAQGATLYLRCAQSHAMALGHEGALVAAAINRYFGYVLIGEVRMTAAPFAPATSAAKPILPPDPAIARRVAAEVAPIADDGLRAALASLGTAMAMRKKR